MKLINNRYRIIHDLDNLEAVSSHLIKDLADNKHKTGLIVTKDNMSDGLLEYYSVNFGMLKNLISRFIMESYDFGVLKKINNKTNQLHQYYFATEYVDNAVSIEAVLYELSFGDALAIFEQVCRAVHFMHLKTLVYGGINFDTIVVTREGDKYCIKLKDLPTMEFGKIYPHVRNAAFFKAPEEIYRETISVKADIYSLGVLLFCLLTKPDGDETDFSSEFAALSSSLENKPEIEALIPVIDKMTADYDNRYASVVDVINDINDILNTDFKAVDPDETERLMFGSKLVGRESESQRITESFNMIISGSSEKRLIGIHGELGIGKSFFLNSIYNTLSLRNLRVYTCTGSDNGNAIKNLLRQILNDCDIPEDVDSSFIMSVKMAAYDLEDDDGLVRQADNNAILKFIYDLIKDSPVMFIVDDIDKVSDDVTDMLDQLITVCKKLMVVFSYRKDNETDNLSNFMKKNRNILLDINLSPFSRDDTEKLIFHSLGMTRTPQAFTDVVYTGTGGNPLFVEEILKSLQLNRLLYTDESDGLWQLRYEHGRIPMPQSINQAMKEHTDKIAKSDMNILKALSVYKTPVSAKYLSPLVKISENELQNRLDEYVRDGLLYSTTDATELKYSFCNDVLKEYIYNKISGKELSQLHNKASKTLIGGKQTELEHADDDEIVYHLEKTSSDTALYEYALSSAKRYGGHLNYGKALLYAGKALAASRRLFDRKKECTVLRMCALYERRNGSIETAIDKLKEARDIAATNRLEGEHAFATSSLAYTLRINGEYRLAAEYLSECDNFFKQTEKQTEFTEAFTWFRDVSISILCDEKRYTEAYDMAVDTIPWYSADDYSGLAYIYQRLGTICDGLGRYEEALEYNDKSSDYFIKDGSISGQITALSNSGAIYMNGLNDFTMAKAVLSDALEIAVRNKAIGNMTHLYRNLAEMNMHELSYQNALFCCSEARQCAEMTGDNRHLPAIDILTGILYTLTNQYDKAYEVLTESVRIYESGGLPPSEQTLLKKFAALFYYRAGMQSEALRYIESSRNDCQTPISLTGRELILLGLRINALSADEDSFCSLHERVRSINIAMGSRIKELDEMCEFFLAALTAVKTECIIDIIQSEFSCDTDDMPFALRSKILYLKSLGQQDDECEKSLLVAYETAKMSDQTLLLIDICVKMGEFFFKANPHRSMIYYAEACELAQELLSGMPDGLRQCFAEHHRLTLPFGRISELETACDPAENEIKNLTTEEILTKDIFSELRSNARFNEAAKRSFQSRLPDGVIDLLTLSGCLGADPEINLVLIANYLTFLTYASRCMFVTASNQSELMVISASGNDKYLPFDNYPAKRAIALECEIISTVDSPAHDDRQMFLDGKKAVMCIPIPYDNSRSDSCIYMYSTSRFHMFTQESLNQCKKLMSLIKLNISFYALKTDSTLDKLTGAYNRAYLETFLDYKIEKAEKEGEMFSIILMDLDKFKSINDTYGHQTGDDVLRALGKIIRSNLRSGTMFGRYGGEEFLVVLDGINETGAFMVAERLRKAIENARILGSKRPVTASMGISAYGVHDVSKAGLIEKADKALYMSKEKGRNRCEIFDRSFEFNAKSTVSFNPLLSGNTMKDAMRMRSVLEIIELIRFDKPFDEKIGTFLDKIRLTCGADYAEFDLTENNRIKRAISSGTQPAQESDGQLNPTRIARTFEALDSGYLIFKPVVKGGITYGYLRVSSEKSRTEFTQTDMGFVEYMCKLLAIMK